MSSTPSFRARTFGAPRNDGQREAPPWTCVSRPRNWHSATALPADLRSKLVEGRRLKKDDLVVWQRILNAKGWAVPHWPAEWGGRNWTPTQHYIFLEELQQAPAP